MNVKTHRWLAFLVGLLVVSLSARAWAKWEEQQLTMENQLHQRIEETLSKALPPDSYLVTVKVELGDSPRAAPAAKKPPRPGTNPFLESNRFVLPGVPEKKQFNTTPAAQDDAPAVEPDEPVLKKLSISVLVAPDVPTAQIASLRDLVSSAVPFNPLRGDELDVAPSPLLKPMNAPKVSTDQPAGAAPRPLGAEFWHDSRTLLLLGLMGAIAIGMIVLVAFLFGPVRAFFKMLVAALPRVGEQAMYAANARDTPATPTATNPFPQTNGHTNGDHPENQLPMPFQFIREDQLSKMPLLFRELTATQAAVVLAYLPPAWASRMLNTLDPQVQTAILKELSQSREIPAEMVKEVETQVRDRLPYYVGGMDWIQSVYQSAPPHMQRSLLEALGSQSPQMAQTLRRKTFFFEDLAGLDAPAMRLLVQDASYPIVALSLREEKPEFRDAVFAKLPGGIAEIVRQEYDLATDDKKGVAEAKERMVVAARRLLAEGRIALGAVK